MSLSLRLAALSALSAVAVSQVATLGPTATLTISDTIIGPDGFNRSAVLVNGVYPAPIIQANKGDSFSLNVVNTLTDTTMDRVTSIHWHGLFQPTTNDMDGVDRVNQCPVVPNNSFLYSYSAPGQAGTYWYHSHVGLQYCDGLRGAFVIYDPNDPNAGLYDVDDETTVIVLSDWYHNVSSQLSAAPTPDSTLVNAAGRYNGGPTTIPFSVTNVTPGLRYRLRIVAAACHPNFIFSIDGHQFTIIEADAQNTDPLTVDSLQILAGQRYSIVLEANQAVDNYWIRVVPDLGPVGFGILRYAGAAATDPTSTNSTSVLPFSEPNLHLLGGTSVPGTNVSGGVDLPLNLNLQFTGGKFFINGFSYSPPSVPVLLQILNGVAPQDLLPAGSVITLPKNSSIEVSLPALNIAGGPHPFHLHGHAFDVVRSALSSTYNYVNPVRRDVVSVGGLNGSGQSNTTIRFTTDNPGPWILHCHIDFHLNAGFAVVFAEDPDDTPSFQTTTEQWTQLCDNYNNFTGSS